MPDQINGGMNERAHGGESMKTEDKKRPARNETRDPRLRWFKGDGEIVVEDGVAKGREGE